jgi:DNA-binding Lrp family transcriptional regulator
MIQKEKEKLAAVILRKEGFSYNEILERVNVSKSTLSLWLRSIGVAKEHKQRFTEKRRLAQLKAQAACRNARIIRENRTIAAAKKEISRISNNEFFLIGIALYWAEGGKQKTHNVSQRVCFSNSDPQMVLLFNRWLKKICLKKDEELIYSIYIHQTADKEKARRFWEKLLGTKIEKMYFKSHNPKTNRKNIDKDYNGLVRIDVRKSTDLNRKIKGWIEGINKNLNIE